VVTSAPGSLGVVYQNIVHTVPPFFGQDNWENLLLSSWYVALDSGVDIAFSEGGTVSIVAPLLGAGARGVPPEIACEAAARAATEWRYGQDRIMNADLHINLLEDEDADLLMLKLESAGWAPADI